MEICISNYELECIQRALKVMKEKVELIESKNPTVMDENWEYAYETARNTADIVTFKNASEDFDKYPCVGQVLFLEEDVFEFVTEALETLKTRIDGYESGEKVLVDITENWLSDCNTARNVINAFLSEAA